MATTDMTFDEAVDNLQSMFERIDRELISTMLRANGTRARTHRLLPRRARGRGIRAAPCSMQRCPVLWNLRDVLTFPISFPSYTSHRCGPLSTATGGHMENTVTQLLELDTTTGEAGTDAAASSSAGPRRASPVSGGPLLDFGGGEAAAATAAAAAAPPAAPPVLRAASSSGSHVDPEAAAAVAAYVPCVPCAPA